MEINEAKWEMMMIPVWYLIDDFEKSLQQEVMTLEFLKSRNATTKLHTWGKSFICINQKLEGMKMMKKQSNVVAKMTAIDLQQTIF